MSVHTAPDPDLDFFAKPIHVESSEAPLTSDAGLLLLRQFDHRLAFTRRFAAALHDPRHPGRIEHSFLDMTRMRMYGILAGYDDQNDHDTLRTDPVFKLLADRSPDADPLASQPTLSRFENLIDIPSLWRLRDVLIDQFIASFAEPPVTLTFDLDAVDDPTHGHQQLTLFHGYYEQYQYLPLVITCAQTDDLVMVSLRHGTATAALGADDDLEYLVGRVRAVWPNVRIRVRGDCGFGVPRMHAPCDRLDVIYTFGQSANAVLQRETEGLLAEAVRRWDETQQPQRLFTGFWYPAGTWDHPRWVIAKCEAHAQGTNRRFITTNRPGGAVYRDAAYDEYAMRGESENRNKEFKCGLGMDRLSDHRFLAKYFRLYLHTAAMNLLTRLRREVADPPPSPTDGAPVEALPEPERKQYQNARRRHDPLGEGQPDTWRVMVIKVAAAVVVRCRRVVIRLSGSWPHRALWDRVMRHVVSRPQVAHLGTG
ncbi:MAG TPA: IS1380 family transposase [Urbifossiella sp.]|nr:IS1380 family transposase [Urbifossiella sp.]